MEPKVESLTTSQLADEIGFRLQTLDEKRNLKPAARLKGEMVEVRYNELHGWSTLTRQDAEQYVTRLRAGHKGRHHEQDAK